VEDEEAPPTLNEPEDEPEVDDDGEDQPEDQDAGPADRGGPLSTTTLLAFAAVLVVFATVMTLLYTHERNVRADDERLLTTSNAQLDAVQGQLNAARGAPPLDPKAYDAIKQCVAAGVEQQRRSEEIQQQLGLPTALPTAVVTAFPTAFVTVFPTGTVLDLPGGTFIPDLKMCEEAATYLK
jgi:hypothetical protein